MHGSLCLEDKEESFCKSFIITAQKKKAWINFVGSATDNKQQSDEPYADDARPHAQDHDHDHDHAHDHAALYLMKTISFRLQASGFVCGLILHKCERAGPSHWQHKKVASKLQRHPMILVSMLFFFLLLKAYRQSFDQLTSPPTLTLSLLIEPKNRSHLIRLQTKN